MAIPFAKIKNKFGLDDTLPFGRHQGYTVLEIIKDRPAYISWLMLNTGIKFHQSVHTELNRCAKHSMLLDVSRTWHGKLKYNWDQRGLSDSDDYMYDIPF